MLNESIASLFSFLLKSVIWEYISSVNIEFIPLARKGFWVDFLDRRFLGKCCFPVQTINARNKNKKRVFHFIFFLKEKSTCDFWLIHSTAEWEKPRNYTGQRVKKKTESIQGNKWPPTRNYTGWKLYRVKNRNHTERKTEIIQGNQVSWCHNKAIKAGLPPWRVRHWRSLKSSDLDKHTIFTIFTIVYEYYVYIYFEDFTRWVKNIYNYHPQPKN